MGLLTKIGQIFKRSNEKGEIHPWLVGTNTQSGKSVTLDSALTVSAIYAAIRVLAESFGSLPGKVYRELDTSGKEIAKDHWLYKLIHQRPNRYQDPFQFKEMGMTHLCTDGNFYCQKLFNGKGQVGELYPLNPKRVEPKFETDKNETLYYEVTVRDGGKVRMEQEDIFHVRGLTVMGAKGLSPIDLARETVGLALAEEEHGAKYFSNGVRPSGTLVHPGKLSKEAAERLQDEFKKKYSGAENAQKLMVLEEGLKFEAYLGLSNEQSQFIDSRKFQINEIARWFRLPPHMIGDLDKATFSNIEQQSLEFVTYTLMPWIIRWEQAIQFQLLADEPKIFAQFLADALLRGDTAARYGVYAVARQNGLMNIDEIREKENMNPLPDKLGQTYLEPLNMKELGSEPDPKQQGNQDGDAEPEPAAPSQPAQKKEEKSLDNFKKPLSDLVERYVSRRANSKESFDVTKKVSRESITNLVESLRGICHPTDPRNKLKARCITEAWLQEWEQEYGTSTGETLEVETERRTNTLIEYIKVI